MNVRDAYTAWSSTYDTVPNPVRDLDIVATQQTLGNQRYPVIIEWGCGTGKNTPFFAALSDQVYAVDFSEGMLSLARAKNTSSNVRFQTADITHPWPFADASADLIVCNLILEHIGDLPPIFVEAYRCLTPRGRFFLCELHPFKQYQGGQARFDNGSEQVFIPAFVHHISDFSDAGISSGFHVERLGEWWPRSDRSVPPLLISYLFVKPADA